MLAVYTRWLELPNHSFFLFGPRSTGKSTWLRQVLPDAQWFDLLRTQTYLSLSRDPGELRQVVLALDPGQWVVVDEVQRIPALLREVHALIAEHGDRNRFALSGSNARKLRRMDVDLLAGRVFERQFFPLTSAELRPYEEPTTGHDNTRGPVSQHVNLETLLRFGSLPKVCAEPQHAIDILEAYVHTYLQQEIQQEALVKDLASFDRFLQIAASANAQVVNTASTARDAGVARPTVQRYFAVLIDTLIGIWLPAWNPKLRAKEVGKPKFYFFDPGVVRALRSFLRDPVHPDERGSLLETLTLGELRAYIEYAGVGGKLSFWRTASGREIDFIWSRGRRHIGIEVKASSRWRPQYGQALHELTQNKTLERGIVVYLGAEERVDKGLRILPWERFTERLWSGEIFS